MIENNSFNFAVGNVIKTGGLGYTGFADGPLSVAVFSNPSGLLYDSVADAIYIADSSNDRIRKVGTSGIVSTFAGANVGNLNGVGTAASFWRPKDIAQHPVTRAIYVTDYRNNLIRKIMPNGGVTTVGGLGGTDSTIDGQAMNVNISSPNGIVFAVDSFYITEYLGHKIRKLSQQGVFTRLAGSSSPLSVDGVGTNAQFGFPTSIAYDSRGYFVFSSDQNVIRKVTLDGTVTTLAGSAVTGASLDGYGTNARFNRPFGVALFQDYAYIADYDNQVVRRLNVVTKQVITVAGTGGIGSANGAGLQAQFFSPIGLCVYKPDKIYLTEYNSGTIRKLTLTGTTDQVLNILLHFLFLISRFLFVGFGCVGGTYYNGTTCAPSPAGFSFD